MQKNTSTDKEKLQNRIKTHEKYSKYDIDEWILGILKIKGNESVLDVGCGTGKQLIPILKMTNGLVVGVDASRESLDHIRKNTEHMDNVRLVLSTMEEMHEKISSFGKFDVIISCFAIYYSKNTEKTLLELKGLLKGKGRLFLCGPAIGNNEALLKLHSKIKEMPHMHQGFFENFAKGFLQKNFSRVEEFTFQNPIEFPDVDALTEYWLSYSIGDKSKENEFRKAAAEQFSKGSKGKFVTVKQVIGLLAYK